MLVYGECERSLLIMYSSSFLFRLVPLMLKIKLNSRCMIAAF